MKTILGIDFGTSNTVVAITTLESRYDPEIVEIDGGKSVDSALILSGLGREILYLGQECWDNVLEFSEQLFFEFKLKIGSPDSFRLSSGDLVSAKDLGVIFLKRLREKIEHQQFNDCPLSSQDVQCVVGYPAEWNEKQKKETLEMVQEAGFPNAVGCEEPIGVVYYHHYKGDLSVEKDQTLLVYDFGGGTTDVAVVTTRAGDAPLVRGVGGNTSLGGKNFDERVAAHLEAAITKSGSLEVLPASDRAIVRRYARLLKEKLSIAQGDGINQVELTIPMLRAKRSPHRVSLSCSEFQEVCQDLVEQFEQPIHQALNKAQTSLESINVSILAGGSGRLYYVRKRLNDAIPNDVVVQSTNPQEVIAKGLAVYGKVLNHGYLPAPSHRERPTDSNPILDKTPRADAGWPGSKKLVSAIVAFLLILFLGVYGLGSNSRSGNPSVRNVTDMLEIFNSNDGTIDEKEFNDAVSAYQISTGNSADTAQCRLYVKKLVLEKGYEVKQGYFNHWFEKISESDS